MNISFNPASSRSPVSSATAAATGAAHPAPREKGLSVTEGKDPGATEGVPILDVPEEALSRTDRLGQLVAAAFNLPAPPPDFLNRA